eukprot:6465671-Amphidinium_carterae.1
MVAVVMLSGCAVETGGCRGACEYLRGLSSKVQSLTTHIEGNLSTWCTWVCIATQETKLLGVRQNYQSGPGSTDKTRGLAPLRLELCASAVIFS